MTTEIRVESSQGVMIGGFQRFSMIDYPGKISAVVFTQGCPFRCSFCHNPSLVLPELFDESFSQEEIMAFLLKRKGQLDAVSVTGGEPTIQRGLVSFFEEIKALGYLIKLDTSGVKPDIVEDLLHRSLVDYIAMDIKAPFEKYHQMAGRDVDTDDIRRSIEMIMASGIDYEFRTTMVKPLHVLEDIVTMAQQLEGAKKYVLQAFVDKVTLAECEEYIPFSQEELKSVIPQAEQYVKNCCVR
jgi:pyruvate formate lyase activating enzyme